MSGNLVETVGLALLHFLWQGAALAVLLFLALRWLNDSKLRYGLSVSVLVLMAFCIPVTLSCLSHAPETMPSLPSAPVVVERVPVTLGGGAVRSSVDLLVAMVWIWCGGVFLFAARSFGGWLMLQRLRRKAQDAVPAALVDRFARLQRRLNIQHIVRYAISDAVDAPAVVGWFRPVVLIPLSALSGLSVEQLEAVMAHELAHIRRYDAVVNLFQIALETLLFYHPAVWWVNKVIRAERENCCDDIAVAVCGDAADYARALTMMGATAQPAWAMSANGGMLKARVARLLGLRKISHAIPRGGLLAIAVLCASCLAVAAVAYKEDPPPPPKPPAAPTSPAMAPEPPPPPAPPVPPAKGSLFADQNEANEQAQRSLDEEAKQLEAQLKQLRKGQLDVSDEQMEQIQKLAQRISAEFQENAEKSQAEALEKAVASMKERYTSDYPELLETQAQLNALKAQLADAANIYGPKNRHYRELSSEIQALTAQTSQAKDEEEKGPSYIDSLESVGLTKLTVDELIALKTQGVTADYVKGIRATGLNPSVQELIWLKVQRITPEFIEKANRHGFKNLTIQQLISLKLARVL